MVLVEQSAVSVSVVAAYRRCTAGANGRGPVRALERVPDHAAAHGLRSSVALQGADVRVDLAVHSVRALLLTQAGETSHRAIMVPEPALASDGPGLPEYYSPEAVSGRILDFVRQASGGDARRLERLVEAVETAFAEVEAILGGNVPEACRRTMAMVREGLRTMLAEFRGESGVDPRVAELELSPESVELAAQVEATADEA